MAQGVFLKLQSHSSTNGFETNIIELLANSVSISVSKTIPAFPVPLSGVFTGESITAALDLGMAQKTISVQGVILDQRIKKTFDGTLKDRFFTAHEVAQMIASGVDSTGFAENQAFNELVILIPSFVDSNYNQRTGVNSGTTINATSDRDEGTFVPFNFASRGDDNELDNFNVPNKLSSFPDSATDTGLTGFVRSFSCDISAETFELTFSLEFETAIIVP
tara:strand:- start:3992 stop:4651 length:660 start_codon:yes stop_codon:yes gene_type:complete